MVLAPPPKGDDYHSGVHGFNARRPALAADAQGPPERRVHMVRSRYNIFYPAFFARKHTYGINARNRLLEGVGG